MILRFVWRMLFVLLFLPVLVCCGGSNKKSTETHKAPPSAPLSYPYVLLPMPSSDDSLLGRVVNYEPHPGQELSAVSRPNPCAEFLTPIKPFEAKSSYLDIQEISASGHGGAYGFKVSAGAATHFYYELSTTKGIVQQNTSEYEECCQEKDCGFGYVSRLIYGDGRYAVGKKADASVDASVMVASAGGDFHLKVLSSREVGGWLAALVTVNPKNQRKKISPECTADLIGPCWSKIQNKEYCYVYNGGPTEDGWNSATWTGECVDWKTNGQGLLTWGATGASYEGEMKGGKAHGQGKYIFREGGYYEGQWKDGKLHGQGKYVFPGGGYYEGGWQDGKQHGQGKHVEADGDYYEGQWQDGKEHGRGKEVFTDGGYYEGEFLDGKADGQGKYVDADGDYYEGQLKDGSFHGQGTFSSGIGVHYEGEWQNGYKHGRGKHKYQNGGVCEGQWRDGKMNGYMRCTSDGEDVSGTAYDDCLDYGSGCFFVNGADHCCN